MPPHRPVAAAAIGMLACLLGCGSAEAGIRPDPCAMAAARPALSAQLLLGGRRGDGRRVSEGEWRRFLKTRITPRFPDGLTVLSGHGQWRGSDGRLREEPSRVVLVVTRGGAGAIAALQAIRAEYKAAFAQQAVGLVLSPGCATF